jgi:hypothetical protein
MRADGRTKTARVGLGGLLLAALLLIAASAGADTPLASPTLTTVASASVAIGGAVTDTAVLVGGSKPSGNITFNLYDPNDPMCKGAPVFTQTKKLALPLTSDPFTPQKAGTYNWVASYGGDSANNMATGKCGDFGESVTVAKATPTVTTVASPGVAAGGRINDQAVLTGAFKPSGTVTFRLYGPGDATCTAAPVFTSTVPETTPTTSSVFSPTAAGTYHWVATYNGDVSNATASSGCADPTEAVVVTGSGTTAPPPGGPSCGPAKMTTDLLASLVGTLTGTPTPFKATCSAGVRIVLRAHEIRPGNPGFPRGDGFTTIANTLTHTTSAGQIGFSFTPQGVGLRTYARSHGVSLIVFAIVHVRPDRSFQSTEAIQIFSLR